MKKWAKRVGLGLAGLVGLVVAIVVSLNIVSVVRGGRTYPVAAETVPVPSDSATLARGKHLAEAVGKCQDCHGQDLGGQEMMNNPVMGRLWAANLTSGRGGRPADYTDADFVRSIRHGTRRDGKSLVFMPAEAYQEMSDEDLGALIAYLKTIPPVDRDVPAPRTGPLARVLHVVGGFPLYPASMVDHSPRARTKPAPGATVEYGKYLATAGGCNSCHGPQLAGGGDPGTPNITLGGKLAGWQEADFFRALREGKRPDGTGISEAMPWKNSGKMTDEEIRAVWTYISSMPKVSDKKS